MRLNRELFSVDAFYYLREKRVRHIGRYDVNWILDENMIKVRVRVSTIHEAAKGAIDGDIFVWLQVGGGDIRALTRVGSAGISS